MPGSYQRPPSAADSWTVDDWRRYRDTAAAHLATHPGWVVGPSLVVAADRNIARLTATALDTDALAG